MERPCSVRGGDLLPGQEGDLPPVQEGDLLLGQEGYLLPVQQRDLLLVQEGDLRAQEEYLLVQREKIFL